MSTHELLPPPAMNVNQIVGYRIRQIRRRLGMTQEDMADRLAEFTGHRLPQASISAMERSANGTRQRRFDAHELALLAQIFDVPIVYFLIPPPRVTEIDGVGPVANLFAGILGRADQLDVVDEPLAELGIGTEDLRHFRQWRIPRLYRLLRRHLPGAEVAETFIEDVTRLVREACVTTGLAHIAPANHPAKSGQHDHQAPDDEECHMDRQQIARNLTAAAATQARQVDWPDADETDAELAELAQSALAAIEEENP